MKVLVACEESQIVYKTLVRKDGKKRGDLLPDAVNIQSQDQGNHNTNGKNRGQLNPAWVEQLMGLPPGWTNFDSWATGLFRQQQQKHG